MLLPNTNGKNFTAKQLKSRMDQVLSVDSSALSKRKTAYLVARAKACDGLTVRQCLKLSYRRADGQVKKFKLSDVAYDLNGGRTVITHTKLLTPAPNVHAAQGHEDYTNRTWFCNIAPGKEACPYV